jgi:hypothetical protein
VAILQPRIEPDDGGLSLWPGSHDDRERQRIASRQQMLDELERRLVDPLHVLQEHDHGACDGKTSDELLGQPKDTLA